jgi:hypothetical protein
VAFATALTTAERIVAIDLGKCNSVEFCDEASSGEVARAWFEITRRHSGAEARIDDGAREVGAPRTPLPRLASTGGPAPHYFRHTRLHGRGEGSVRRKQCSNHEPTRSDNRGGFMVDEAQQRRGPSELRTREALDPPVDCCSGWFGAAISPHDIALPLSSNVPDSGHIQTSVGGNQFLDQGQLGDKSR